jgi:hypothetical protein
MSTPASAAASTPATSLTASTTNTNKVNNSTGSANESTQTAKKRSFVYVLLPADESKAPQEHTVWYSTEGDESVACLGKAAVEHFKTLVNPSVSAGKLKSAIQQQLSSKLAAGQTLPQNVLDQFAAMTSFDMVPILKNLKATDWVGVNLYVDDQAVAKELPLNRRASLLCGKAGIPFNIIGDALVGRLVDDGSDLFERKDFTLNDLNPEAPWFDMARRQAAQAGKADTREQYKSLLTAKQPPKSCGRGGVGSGTCSLVGSKRCSRCKAIFYCSPECQKLDWSRHKKDCVAV